jgi:hypothetical protein
VTVISRRAFFLPDRTVLAHVWAYCGAAVLAGATVFVHARELAITVGEIRSPSLSAQNVRAQLSGPALQTLTVHIGSVSVAGRTWRNATASCGRLGITETRIDCGGGVLHAGEKIPMAFSYERSRYALSLELKPQADETWSLAGHFGSKPATVDVRLQKARMERIASWFPTFSPKITAGRADATLTFRGDAADGRLDVHGLAFSDASGLHAAENVAATIEVVAARKSGSWHWRAGVTWGGGGLYWQPVFFTGSGQRLEVDASSDGVQTAVHSGRLDFPELGNVRFKAQWNHRAGSMGSYEVSAARIRADALYGHFFKPFLEGTALADLTAAGELSFNLRGTGTTLSALDLELNDLTVEDRQRRFAVFALNGRVPWQRDAASEGTLDIKAAELLKVPLGRIRIPLRTRSTRVDVGSVRVPIFDGAVHLRNFAARLADDGWRWRFNGEIEPISMVQLTDAFGLPLMHGSLSGAIPELRYRRGMLAMDGALTIRVFDGVVTAEKLELIEPFGRAPRLHADIHVDRLDLELLTRTYDFGTITGRIDARVRGLELVNWQPVRFEGRMQSSAGSYPRKISQRAVQNISALGGAGAAAAIQRSLLRFFDEFGYQRLGISCRLENGVCLMNGIEPAPQGYVIVKGGGVPAISVIGYNRVVNWRELVERLKRITQDNVKPMVK